MPRKAAAIGSWVHHMLIGKAAFLPGPVVSKAKEACPNMTRKMQLMGRYIFARVALFIPTVHGDRVTAVIPANNIQCPRERERKRETQRESEQEIEGERKGDSTPTPTSYAQTPKALPNHTPDSSISVQ